jgi:deoxyadenosine/deoxycytidine kinase
MTNDEFRLFLRWYNREVPPLDLQRHKILFLDLPDVETQVQRIRERERDMEKEIDVEFLRSLWRYYVAFPGLCEERGFDVIRFDATIDIRTPAGEQQLLDTVERAFEK